MDRRVNGIRTGWGEARVHLNLSESLLGNGTRILPVLMEVKQ